MRFDLAIIALLCLNVCATAALEETDVVVAALALSHQHLMPYLLGILDKLSFPKSRILLYLHEEVWIENGEDNVVAPPLATKWFANNSKLYHPESLFVKGSRDRPAWNERNETERRVKIYQIALKLARDHNAEVLFVIEPRSLILYNGVIEEMMQMQLNKDYLVAAPMLGTLGKNSNFWCRIDENGEYVYSNDCEEFMNYREMQVFHPELVNSCFMIFMGHEESSSISFNATSLNDSAEILEPEAVLALHMKRLGLKFAMSNKRIFGYLLQDFSGSERTDQDQIAFLKQELIMRNEELRVTEAVETYDVRYLDGLQDELAEVYVINLDRQEDRMYQMQLKLNALGINYTRITAQDGYKLNPNTISDQGITTLPGYRHYDENRLQTTGEIANFISHYEIWQDIIAKKHNSALILEDDTRFGPYFRSKLQLLLNDTKRINLDYDVLYLGRKKLTEETEMTTLSSRIVKSKYSAWSMAYILTYHGALKLVNSKPLEKIVPVDEYLQIMSDQHPNAKWKSVFRQRDLKTYSAYPCLVFANFFSTTEGYVANRGGSRLVDIGGYFVRDEL